MKTKIYLLPVFFMISCWAVWGQEGNLQQSMQRGKIVYAASCASCHLPQGTGVIGAFPYLSKNPFLKNQKRVIQIVLEGLDGEIMVDGKKYNGSMAELNYLKDREIADVLNYVSNSWGNKNRRITPAHVKAERE